MKIFLGLLGTFFIIIIIMFATTGNSTTIDLKGTITNADSKGFYIEFEDKTGYWELRDTPLEKRLTTGMQVIAKIQTWGTEDIYDDYLIGIIVEE